MGKVVKRDATVTKNSTPTTLEKFSIAATATISVLPGILAGAVAGVLGIRGHVIAGTNGITASGSHVQLDYEIFIAGLILKRVTEAAGGKPVP